MEKMVLNYGFDKCVLMSQGFKNGEDGTELGFRQMRVDESDFPLSWDGVLFDLILKAFGPHHEASYESNDDYTPQGVLLSKNYVCLYVAKDPLYGSWKDSLNVRVSK